MRLFPPRRLHATCRCSQERVLGMLKSFPPAELADMVEGDGAIHVTCEYCSRVYAVTPEAVDG